MHNNNLTIADPEGRYIIISGSIGEVKLTIANLYSPNEDNPAFYYLHIIIGGDVNTTIDPKLDRSNVT